MKKLIIFLLVIGLGLTGYLLYMNHRLNRLEAMSFEDMVHYTMGDDPDAAIAVGIVQNGEVRYLMFGEQEFFEIGSLTKTFTAKMIFDLAEAGRIDLDSSIDHYLELPDGYYPTVRELINHVSGYKSWYFESEMMGNFFDQRNDYFGISHEKLLARIGNIDLDDASYGFKYSNFGYAVLGAILSEFYQEDFATLMERFIAEELGMRQTSMLNPLSNGWEWSVGDAYRAAGALTSTITDMTAYAKMLLPTMNRENDLLINATTARNAMLNIRADGVLDGWMVDRENEIIWHNGGTGQYNSYLGFDLQNDAAVVVLSNLPPDYRIPATVMGAQLLLELR